MSKCSNLGGEKGAWIIMSGFRTVTVNGRIKRAIDIKGQLYIRKEALLPIEMVARFENLCAALIEDERRVLTKLAIEFTNSRGWWDSHPEVKTAGDLFDRNPVNYIRNAVNRFKNSMIPPIYHKE